MTEIVYKICYNHLERGFVSTFASHPWEVVYEIGKLTKPHFENSKLFVYKGLAEADDAFGSGLVLLECETEGPVEPIVNITCQAYKWMSFWEGSLPKKSYWDLTPYGSFVVPFLTPLKIVKK